MYFTGSKLPFHNTLSQLFNNVVPNRPLRLIYSKSYKATAKTGKGQFRAGTYLPSYRELHTLIHIAHLRPSRNCRNFGQEHSYYNQNTCILLTLLYCTVYTEQAVKTYIFKITYTQCTKVRILLGRSPYIGLLCVKTAQCGQFRAGTYLRSYRELYTLIHIAHLRPSRNCGKSGKFRAISGRDILINTHEYYLHQCIVLIYRIGRKN